jgi:hypothetical protein
LITWNSSKFIAVIPPGFTLWSVNMNPRNNTLFPWAINRREFPADPFQTTSFAHWFLIVLFLLPWTAFLLWRGRRLGRITRKGSSALYSP